MRFSGIFLIMLICEKMDSNNYLEQLNSEQRAAVEYIDGPELVIAGAGSGKTRVLTYKIVHLLRSGVKPWNIMALTFTNKAAREMRERIEQMVSLQEANLLWMGTFHSIFARIIRFNAQAMGLKSNYTIYDASDSLSAIRNIIKSLGLDDKHYKAPSVQARISDLKNAMVSPGDYETNKQWSNQDVECHRPHTGLIYRMYCEQCRASNALDFDDLLVYTNLLLRDNAEIKERYQNLFQYILVDEYQDTNFAQVKIIEQLSNEQTHLCVVGDDAQSIYSFRGANIYNILNLQKVYPTLKIFKLEENYRSTQNILSAANSLIDKNTKQYRKHIFSNKGLGNKVVVRNCVSEYEEAYAIANEIMRLKRQKGYYWSDFAILFRTNSQSRILERALRSGGLGNDHGNTRLGIPYRVYGGLAFYQRKEVKDAISYFKVSINPDNESLRRIINFPRRGIGDTTVSKIAMAAQNSGTSMWQVLCHPANYVLDLNKGTLKRLHDFQLLVEGMQALDNGCRDACAIAEEIINRSGLLQELAGEHDAENISRQENIKELLSGIKEFVDNRLEESGHNATLAEYLTDAALATDQDLDNSQEDCVTLMTAHAAKGLEFKNIFISGVIENRFPSYRSKDRLEDVEEERRLLYVAITRAMENCYIFHSNMAIINGKSDAAVKSRFLDDIDSNYLSQSGSSAHRKSAYESTALRWNSFDTDLPSNVSLGKKSLGDRVPIPSPSTPRVKPTTGVVASSGSFSVHSIDELSEGMNILHERFGFGVIETVIDKEGKIIVNFDDIGDKTLLLKFAKFEIQK